MQLNYQQPTIQLAIHHHISEIVNETKNRSQTDISEATWKQNGKAIYSQTQFHCYWSLQSPEVMVQNTDHYKANLQCENSQANLLCLSLGLGFLLWNFQDKICDLKQPRHQWTGYDDDYFLYDISPTHQPTSACTSYCGCYSLLLMSWDGMNGMVNLCSQLNNKTYFSCQFPVRLRSRRNNEWRASFIQPTHSSPNDCYSAQPCK